jgi:hypothetical protein
MKKKKKRKYLVNIFKIKKKSNKKLKQERKLHNQKMNSESSMSLLI